VAPDGDLPDWGRRFGALYRETLVGWGRRFEDWHREGRRVAIWGAGTKGVMFLNSVPGAAAVVAVVDVSPRKTGAWVAGTGQRILAPRELSAAAPDVVLAMNPVYREEIAAEIRELGLDAEVLAV
jgi:hypothetical protein